MRERGPAYWETIAARMVDAQAGGMATRLRGVSGLCFQSDRPGWEEQLSGELAAIYMLSHAYGCLDQLPPAPQCEVRSQIGWTVPQEEVLAETSVLDCWQVLGQRTTDEGRIRARATWLRGSASGRWALLLHYSAGGQGFDTPLSTGTTLDAELCFYPSAFPQRALVKRLSGVRPLEGAHPAAAPLEEVLDGFAGALAVQPFLERYPMMLSGAPDAADRTVIDTADGRRLALHGSFRHASHLLALSGGHPLTLIGEWDGVSLLPLSVWQDGRLYNIETDFGA